jgi:hypothetical protein
VFREVGAHAIAYCPVGDVNAWARAIGAFALERQHEPSVWAARRLAGRLHARSSSWARFADRMVEIYRELAA